MHCRVRYLLDFDLKIRSGQVCIVLLQKVISKIFFWFLYQTHYNGGAIYFNIAPAFANLIYQVVGYLRWPKCEKNLSFNYATIKDR